MDGGVSQGRERSGHSVEQERQEDGAPESFQDDGYCRRVLLHCPMCAPVEHTCLPCCPHGSTFVCLTRVLGNDTHSGRQRQEGQEFKASFSYIATEATPRWCFLDPICFRQRQHESHAGERVLMEPSRTLADLHH